jgi:hypothetical protein
MNYADQDQISPGSHLDDNGQQSTPNPSERYGAFRVCWYEKGGTEFHKASVGNWNEGAATDFAAQQEAAGHSPVWIEHQDPDTKEWKRW